MKRILAIGVGVFLSVGLAGGEELLLRRRPFTFGITVRGSVSGVDTLGRGDTLRIRIGAAAEYHGIACVHISVPPELAVVAGDTAATIDLRQSRPPMTVSLVGAKMGSGEVRGTAVFRQKGYEARDEAEFSLPVVVETSRVMTGPVEYLRAERVSSGKRYRYTRGWLIPVEEPTPVVEEELERTGKRPAVLAMEAAYCRSCSAAEDTVMFVVVVSKAGKLVAARAVGLPGRDRLPTKDAERVARTALERWKFRPGEFRGRQVTDWVYVRVPIMRDP